MSRTHRSLSLLLVLAASTACTSTAPSAEPVAASNASPTAAAPAALPNGTYQAEATREQALAAGFTDAQIEEQYGPDGVATIVLRLLNGSWTQLADYNGAALEPGDIGTYRVDGQQLVLTSSSPGCPGCVSVLDYTFDGTTMSLRFAEPAAAEADERLMLEHDYTVQG